MLTAETNGCSFLLREDRRLKNPAACLCGGKCRHCLGTADCSKFCGSGLASCHGKLEKRHMWFDEVLWTGAKNLRTTGLEPIHHKGEAKKCQVSFACRFKALKTINAFESYSGVKC